MRPKSRERRPPKHRRQDSTPQGSSHQTVKRVQIHVSSSPPQALSSFHTQSTQPLAEPDKRRTTVSRSPSTTVSPSRSAEEEEELTAEEKLPSDTEEAEEGRGGGVVGALAAAVAQGVAAAAAAEEEVSEDEDVIAQIERHQRESVGREAAAAAAELQPDKEKGVGQLHYTSSLVARIGTRIVGRHHIGSHSEENAWTKAKLRAQLLLDNYLIVRTEVCCQAEQVRKKDEFRTDVYSEEQFLLAQYHLVDWMRQSCTNLRMNFDFLLEKEVNPYEFVAPPNEVLFDPS
ncbi:hypothetical protein LTR08_004351 [Meristemomyces frigidus]|nr:hypothetical protein LTR08_004351 [Meristemomyces frigidus]